MHMRTELVAVKQHRDELESKVEHLETMHREQLVEVSALKHQLSVPSVEHAELQDRYTSIVSAHDRLMEQHRTEARRADELEMVRNQLDLKVG